MSISVRRERTIKAPLGDALTALLYDWKTADPWRTSIRPSRDGGRLHVRIASPDASGPVIRSEIRVRRDGNRVELTYGSDNPQGSFRGRVVLVGAGERTLMRISSSVEPRREFRDVLITEDSYRDVIGQVADRVAAVATLLVAPGSQLPKARVDAVRRLVGAISPDLGGTGLAA